MEWIGGLPIGYLNQWWRDGGVSACRLKLSVADRHYGHDVYHRCEDYKARSSPDEATVVYPHCPYFARKFAKHSAKEVADVLEQLRIAA